MPPAPFEAVPGFAELGVRAFTTTRILGNLSVSSDEPASEITTRWDRVRGQLGAVNPRLATAKQVHGINVIVHGDGWSGWLRGDAADGHVTAIKGTALGVSVADCVPVFIAHPSGIVAMIHAGWRGVAAGILARALTALGGLKVYPRELSMHLGPAICGQCYEVGRDVYFAVSGRTVADRGLLDLRAEIAGKASAAGVRTISISEHCTRHHNDLFFSHRCGDSGRQFAFIVANRD